MWKPCKNREVYRVSLRTPIFSERRFKVREYPLDPVGKSPAELQNYQLKVQNTMLAQDNLPPSPYIVKAECRVSDDGMRYYEKSDYMDETHFVRSYAVVHLPKWKEQKYCTI